MRKRKIECVCERELEDDGVSVAVDAVGAMVC